MAISIIEAHRPTNFFRFLLALVLGNIVLQSAKYGFDMDRPLRVLGPNQTCVLGPGITLRSFPSGHAFTAILFLMHLRPANLAWAIPVTALALLATISRIYVGAHFPRDIAAGGLLAVAAYAGAERISNKFPTVRFSTIVPALGLGTAVIYIFVYQEKTAELEFILTPLAYVVLAYWLYQTTTLWYLKIKFLIDSDKSTGA